MATYPKTIIAFDSIAAIRAGDTAPLIVSSDTAFNAEFLIIPEWVSHGFLITKFTIGKVLQLSIKSYPIPSEVFTSKHESKWYDFDRVLVHQDLVLEVCNTTSSPARFMASLIGSSLKFGS